LYNKFSIFKTVLSDEKSLLNLSEDLRNHSRQIVVGATKFSLRRD